MRASVERRTVALVSSNETNLRLAARRRRGWRRPSRPAAACRLGGRLVGGGAHRDRPCAASFELHRGDHVAGVHRPRDRAVGVEGGDVGCHAGVEAARRRAGRSPCRPRSRWRRRSRCPSSFTSWRPPRRRCRRRSARARASSTTRTCLRRRTTRPRPRARRRRAEHHGRDVAASFAAASLPACNATSVVFGNLPCACSVKTRTFAHWKCSLRIRETTRRQITLASVCRRFDQLLTDSTLRARLRASAAARASRLDAWARRRRRDPRAGSPSAPSCAPS